MKKTTIELNMSLCAYSFPTPEDETIVCCTHMMEDTYYIQDGKRIKYTFKTVVLDKWWDNLFESLGVTKPLDIVILNIELLLILIQIISQSILQRFTCNKGVKRCSR